MQLFTDFFFYLSLHNFRNTIKIVYAHLNFIYSHHLFLYFSSFFLSGLASITRITSIGSTRINIKIKLVSDSLSSSLRMYQSYTPYTKIFLYTALYFRNIRVIYSHLCTFHEIFAMSQSFSSFAVLLQTQRLKLYIFYVIVRAT